MERRVRLWALMGFATTSLGGTILHFLYDWLGGAVWIAPFSGVNESTWEHMKLLFVPMMVFAVIQSFFFRKCADFWCVKLRSILLGLMLIPVIFYTYNGVIGHSPDWINIAIFFISAMGAYVYEARSLCGGMRGFKQPRLAVVILVIIAILFVVFTFMPPNLAIFKDPLA